MEQPELSIPYQPSNWLKVPAKIISYVLHPVFVPTYFFLFMVWQFRSEFPTGFEETAQWKLNMKIFGVFWMTAFFPMFAVFLLWKVKFSNSIFLRTQKERIVPYFISMFFYWWMYYLSRNFTDQPAALKFFYFGIFIATAVGVVFNNFIKISLHGIGMGGLLAAVVLTSFFYQTPLGIAISVTALLTGLVCTSRFLVSDHTSLEVYSGLLVGIGCQLFGYWFV